MNTIQDASQIALLVIILVGFVKPFIPESKADIIPGIAVLIGIILSFVLKVDSLSVIDGIMGSLAGVATYKVGSTSLKSTGETDDPKKNEVEKLIDLLNKLKK